MRRRTFLLSAIAAPAVAVLPLPAPEFEITRPDPYGYLEVLRREDLLQWPWQARAVRWINGREFEWCALSERYPTEKDLARYRVMVDAAFERAKAGA